MASRTSAVGTMPNDSRSRRGTVSRSGAADVSFRDVFEHALFPMAVLRGPEHVFALVNGPWRSAVGERRLIGRPIRAAFPDGAGHALHELLDRVYQTDRSEIAVDMPIAVDRRGDGALEQVFLTVTCQPLHDGADRVEGALLQAVDVTAAVRARSDAETAAGGLREANERLILAGLREQAVAEAADDARRRATLLAESSRHLSASFDYERTLQAVAALAVPTIADLCFVDVVAADGSIRRVAWAHADPAQPAGLAEGRQHVPDWGRTSDPVVQALRSGEPVVVPAVSPAWRRAAASGAEHLRFMRAVDFRSLMTVPLLAGERRLGAMTFCFTALSGRQYRPEELALAEELAGRAALAVENARLYRELEQALRLRDDFLTTTAHDLRSPLTSVRGYAQLWHRRVLQAVAAPPLDTAGLADGLTHIERTASTMTNMVEGLMDAARLQAGQTIELFRRSTNLVALAQLAIASVKRVDESRDIRLDAEVPSLVGQWDPARLERVLHNLLGNAVKYSPEGGQITVTVRLVRHGAWAELAVRDQGIGIPEADQARLFQWFHRGANVLGRIPGMGIGLAGTRSIVEQHGGTITVASREGAGSTFTVHLPLAPPGPA
jgi:signal transduction histidine kinase